MREMAGGGGKQERERGRCGRRSVRLSVRLARGKTREASKTRAMRERQRSERSNRISRSEEAGVQNAPLISRQKRSLPENQNLYTFRLQLFRGTL